MVKLPGILREGSPPLDLDSGPCPDQNHEEGRRAKLGFYGAD